MEFEREEFVGVSSKKSQEDLDRYHEDRLNAIGIIKRLVELDKAEAKKPSKSRRSFKHQTQGGS